jgi:hypothetical protein
MVIPACASRSVAPGAIEQESLAARLDQDAGAVLPQVAERPDPGTEQDDR